MRNGSGDGFDDDFSKWSNIVDTLKKGGMTDIPQVAFACNWFIETNGDYSHLEKLLEYNPGILNQARRNIIVDKHAKEDNPFHPAPSGDDLDDLKGEINIGEVNSQNDKVGLDPIDFTKGFFVCGESGSGKSYPIFRMLDQILSIPINKRGYNVIIIQTLKNDANFLFRNHSSLKVFEWNDLKYAPLYVEKWDRFPKKRNSFFDVYKSVNWLMGHSQPMLERCLDISFKKHGQNNIKLEMVLDEVDKAAESLKLTGHSYKDVKDHLKLTLSNCISKGGLLNSFRGFPVDDFFTKEDMILNFDDLSSDYVVGTFLCCLFKDIQRYYTVKALPTKLRTLLVIDECRRVFPPEQTYSTTNHDPNLAMMNFVTTRRSSGIGLIAATQEIKSVPSWLKSNSAHVLAMPISGDSRDDVSKLINLNPEQSSYFDELGEYGIGIMRYRGFNRRFIVDIPSDLNDTPMDSNVIHSMMEEYIDHLHSKYSAEPTIKELEVHKEEIKPIKDWKADEKKSIDKANSFAVIRELVKNPFQNYTEVRSLTGLSAQRMRGSVDLLLDEGFAEQIVCMGSKGKKAKYIVLTDKIPDRNMKNAFFFKHTLYEFRVMGFLKANSYKDVVREYFGDKKKGEKPSFINVTTRAGEKKTILKRIDVLGVRNDMKEAFEVTLSFSNLVDNIHKCLEIFKVDFLTIVVEDSKEAKNIQKANILVKSRVPEVFHSRISFKLISDFCIKGNV